MSSHLKVFILALCTAAASVAVVTHEIEIQPEGPPYFGPAREIEIQPEGAPAREIEIQPEGLFPIEVPQGI